MKKNNWFKKTFGSKLGIADIILILAIIGYPIYVGFKEGFQVIIEEFAGFIWAGVLVAYIVNLLIRKAKK